MTNDEIKEFLKDLNRLTRKHKIAIGGCGCCGSPFLYSLKKNEGRYKTNDVVDGKDVENLTWVKEGKE